jgi:hypothetical protein
MYARKTAFKTSSDNVYTAKKVFSDEVLPLARKIPGFSRGPWRWPIGAPATL